jgi:hypothetical protein
MIPTRVEEEGRRGKRKEMMESLMQAHVHSHPGQYRPRRGGRVGKGRGGVAGVGIGSNAREEGSGKNGYVCGYLHSAQQDAMDVAPHNHTCTQGETCSKLGSRSALTFGVIREKLSRLGRARGKQKGGVVVGSLCGPGSVGPGTSLGF